MKLIIQKMDGSIYAYRESNSHHKKMQKQRGKPLDASKLDHECDLGKYEDFHMVVDIKKSKKGKKK